MKRTNFRAWILPIVALILAIPFTLNILLQLEIKSPINIIRGSEGGAVTWLQFWGSYLAALGSFVMAIIAYVQGADNRSDNLALRAQNTHKTKYESIKKDYDIFEHIVADNTKLYTVRRFTKIAMLCETGNYPEAKISQGQLFEELNLSSLYAARFCSEIEDNSKINEYISLLRHYNSVYLRFAIEVKECLNEHDLDKRVMTDKLYNICAGVEKLSSETKNLTNVGVEVLMQFKNNMDKALEQYNNQNL